MPPECEDCRRMAELNADLMLRIEPLRRSLERTADGVARLEERFPGRQEVLAQLTVGELLHELRARLAASWRGGREFLRRGLRHPAAPLARTDSRAGGGASRVTRYVTPTREQAEEAYRETFEAVRDGAGGRLLDLERCPITGLPHAWVDAGDPDRPYRDACPDCKATKDPLYGPAEVPDLEELTCGVCGAPWDLEHEGDAEGCPLLERRTRGSRLADGMAALTRAILGGPGPTERAEQVRRAHAELFPGDRGPWTCACTARELRERRPVLPVRGAAAVRRVRPYPLEGCRHVDLSADWRRPVSARTRRSVRLLQRFADARFPGAGLRVVASTRRDGGR